MEVIIELQSMECLKAVLSKASDLQKKYPDAMISIRVKG